MLPLNLQVTCIILDTDVFLLAFCPFCAWWNTRTEKNQKGLPRFSASLAFYQMHDRISFSLWFYPFALYFVFLI